MRELFFSNEYCFSSRLGDDYGGMKDDDEINNDQIAIKYNKNFIDTLKRSPKLFQTLWDTKVK